MSDFIYGINPVKECLRGRRRLIELFVDQKSAGKRIDQIIHLAKQRQVPIRYRTQDDLDSLAGQPYHQGVVLHAEAFPYASLDDLLSKSLKRGDNNLLLMIDGVTDPQNLGAIIRNADAAGCQAVVITKDRCCNVTNVVDKAAAGAVEHIEICKVTNLARAIETLKKNGFWIYGLASSENAHILFKTDLSGSIALVVGGEADGLRSRTRQLCDGLLEIPMCGGVTSLNAASACAVALFEVVRQRDHDKE